MMHEWLFKMLRDGSEQMRYSYPANYDFSMSLSCMIRIALGCSIYVKDQNLGQKVLNGEKIPVERWGKDGWIVNIYEKINEQLAVSDSPQLADMFFERKHHA